jgi:hypothetical protein
VKECPAEFRARTGRGYAPAADLPGRALADDEPCPTLHRWPGAGALHDALARTLDRLGPPGSGELWLSEDARAIAPGGAGRFGALIVLEPLRLGVRRVGGGVWVAPNRPIEPDLVVWCPAATLDAGWDAVATPEQARALLGPGHDDARAAAVDGLAAYLEELAELRRAGAPAPATPWCELDAATRARRLAEHGVAPRWSR